MSTSLSQPALLSPPGCPAQVRPSSGVASRAFPSSLGPGSPLCLRVPQFCCPGSHGQEGMVGGWFCVGGEQAVCPQEAPVSQPHSSAACPVSVACLSPSTLLSPSTGVPQSAACGCGADSQPRCSHCSLLPPGPLQGNAPPACRPYSQFSRRTLAVTRRWGRPHTTRLSDASWVSYGSAQC